jgi:hypothetical protein
MIDVQMLKVIIWGILGIFGLLLAISMIKTEKRLDWRIGIGIPLFGISLFVLVTEFPEYGIGFSILGTLILAGIALMSIKQSYEQANDDKREHKLIAIVTWANDIAKCETDAPLAPLPIVDIVKLAPELGKEKVGAILDYRITNSKTNLIMRYQSLEAMKPRIIVMANRLDKQLGTDLGTLTQQTADKLEEHVELGWKFIKEEITDTEYKEHWKSLVNSALALAEKAEQVID